MYATYIHVEEKYTTQEKKKEEEGPPFVDRFSSLSLRDEWRIKRI